MKFFPRFFLLYFLVFHIYFFSYAYGKDWLTTVYIFQRRHVLNVSYCLTLSTGFSYLALMTTAAFMQHLILYFWNRFEVNFDPNSSQWKVLSLSKY